MKTFTTLIPLRLNVGSSSDVVRTCREVVSYLAGEERRRAELTMKKIQ